MYKLIFILFFTFDVYAKYTNCNFQNSHYSDICKDVVQKGVSVEYANKFLLSYFKTKKYDQKSWKYLQPSYIKQHKKNEKKANNLFVKKIPQLVQHLKKYKKVYDYTEKKYGVDREVVGAVLLKETNLGKYQPKHDAFIVFNTIVTKVKEKTTRQKWLMKMGKTNMASIIKYCYNANLIPEQCNLPSSYAGAVGIPQFMPNNFIYAKSYKNNIADLTKMEDAIVSASYYLHKRAKYNQLIDWSKIPNMRKIENHWYEFDFINNNASFAYDKGKYQCYACNKDDLQYLIKYVKKLMKYNNSSNYAIGVLRLAYDASFSNISSQ